MKVDEFTNPESLQSFKEWWKNRIHKHDGKNPHMPDFFEVWNARQQEIDKLKKENEELKNTIEKIKTGK
jgi:cell division protein FtsB